MTFIKLFQTLILIIIILSIICCSITNKECNGLKSQILLEEIFSKKEFFYFNNIVQPLDNSIYNKNDSNLILIDSSRYFVNLYIPNLKIPNKSLYLHMDKPINSREPDSVILRPIDNINKQSKYAPTLIVELIAVNSDTTNVRVRFSYSYGRTLWNELDYSFSFNQDLCKWITRDSIIWRY